MHIQAAVLNAAPAKRGKAAAVLQRHHSFQQMILRVVLPPRFKNQILCDLHFADVALMECSDFMQQLRSFKPQSLGCAVARRKSSTTLIFPLPPQACSGKCSSSPSSREITLALPLLFTIALRFPRTSSAPREQRGRRLLNKYICMRRRRSYRWFRPSWITHDYMCEATF